MNDSTRITKATALMTRLDSDNQDAEISVTFVLDQDDTGRIYRTLLLSFDDWTELGRPDVVTVTVEPGDTLNGDQP